LREWSAELRFGVVVTNRNPPIRRSALRGFRVFCVFRGSKPLSFPLYVNGLRAVQSGNENVRAFTLMELLVVIVMTNKREMGLLCLS
jgi:hypothetical protein